jgi:molybdopterin molybdotransferase
MQSLEDAQARIRTALAPLPSIRLPLAASAGHVLQEPVNATVDLPGFDNSAMDGYAVRARDVGDASATRPATLQVIGEVPAGRAFEGMVADGQCVRIFTGSPLPAGADAVVMQEDTTRSGDQVQIRDRVRPFENVRLCGEDIKAGHMIGSSGLRITAGMLNLFAAAGIAEVRVSRPPRIALLATGDELREPGAQLQPGQIFESNRGMLAELLRDAGAVSEIVPIVADTRDATRTALATAFGRCDAVITTGGVSVGDHDHVKDAFAALGGTLDFWKVAVKPGKPFAFGRLDGRFLFGLPGNPVSAFVTFLLLVRPALLAWQGAQETGLPAHPAVLRETLTNRGDRRHFMRVHVDAEGIAASAGVQGSHMLHSLARANALVEVPPETTLAAGSRVTALRFAF